eukprot:jgi/Botrbrau1/13296/Bobra.27_2s0016.1
MFIAGLVTRSKNWTLRTAFGSASRKVVKRRSNRIVMELPEAPLAIVKCVGNEENITIAVELSGRQRFMARPKLEPLQRCLDRMAMNAAPKPDKKASKRKHTPAPAPKVQLLREDGCLVPGGL